MSVQRAPIGTATIRARPMYCKGISPQGDTHHQACRRDKPVEETRDRPNQNGRQNMTGASRYCEASRSGEQRNRCSSKSEQSANRLTVVIRRQCPHDRTPRNRSPSSGCRRA
jgi:hypothetical protein